MPTYVYRNPATGETKDIKMSLAAKERLGVVFTLRDTHGHTDTWKQVFTAAPVHFKGGGFYSTSSKA